MKICANILRAVPAICALLLMIIGVCLQAETIDGYITSISSSTVFYIGDMQVLMSKNTICKEQTIKYTTINGRTILIYKSIWTPKNIHSSSCSAVVQTIGSRVRLIGDRAGDKNIFKANMVVVYQIRFPFNPSRLNDGVILEETSNFIVGEHGVGGYAWMDGYPIGITSKTRFIKEDNHTRFSFGYNFSYIGSKPKPGHGHLIKLPPAQLKANTCVVFHATRDTNRKFRATSVQFWRNRVDSRERRYNERFNPVIVPTDYRKKLPGFIQFTGAPPIEILPEKNIQQFIEELGWSLVPAYQKNLIDSDETKIHFRFYVVKDFKSRLGRYFVETRGYMPKYQLLYWNSASKEFYTRPKVDEVVTQVVSSPSGVIMVPDVSLIGMKNEAQLAAMISTAIASVIQRQSYHGDPRFFATYAFNDPGMNGPWQTQQALRIGIRQMYLAGYDIREAPFAWAVAQGKPVQNPIINSKHPDKEIPWYAAYAFNYISQYYRDVDYSKLKRGEREYQQFLQELYKADPSLPRPKAQLEPQAQLESQPQLKLQAQPRPVCTPTQAAKDAACMGHSATQGTAQPAPQSSATPANFAPKQAPAQAATAH